MFPKITYDHIFFAFFLPLMPENDQQDIDAHQKARAALEAVCAVRPIHDIARDYGVDASVVRRWKQALIENAASLFVSDGPASPAISAEQMQANEALVLKILEHQHAEAALQQSQERLHQLLVREDRIKEEERKRIAREIHDELGQNLLAVRIDISMLHARTAQRAPRLHRRAELALQNIDETIKSVKSIINDLRPFELELGLQAAVEWQLKRFEQLSGVACALSIDDAACDDALGDAPTLAVFRILQESLSNIARHSLATKVEVALSRDERLFSMRVKDNGVGMHPDAETKANTFGLVGIEERLSPLHGELIIDSEDGNGTMLSVFIPIED